MLAWLCNTVWFRAIDQLTHGCPLLGVKNLPLMAGPISRSMNSVLICLGYFLITCELIAGLFNTLLGSLVLLNNHVYGKTATPDFLFNPGICAWFLYLIALCNACGFLALVNCVLGWGWWKNRTQVRAARFRT